MAWLCMAFQVKKGGGLDKECRSVSGTGAATEQKSLASRSNSWIQGC